MGNQAVLVISVLWSAAVTLSCGRDIDGSSKTEISPLLRLIRQHRDHLPHKSSNPSQTAYLGSSVNWHRDKNANFPEDGVKYLEQAEQEFDELKGVLYGKGSEQYSQRPSDENSVWLEWMDKNRGKGKVVARAMDNNDDTLSRYALHGKSRYKRDTVFEAGTSLWAVLGGLGCLLLLFAIGFFCWWSRSCGVQKGADGEIPPDSITGARIFMAGHGYENMGFDCSEREGKL